jgi:hypothetical protein
MKHLEAPRLFQSRDHWRLLGYLWFNEKLMSDKWAYHVGHRNLIATKQRIIRNVSRDMVDTFRQIVGAQL